MMAAQRNVLDSACAAGGRAKINNAQSGSDTAAGHWWWQPATTLHHLGARRKEHNMTEKKVACHQCGKAARYAICPVCSARNQARFAFAGTVSCWPAR